MQFPTPVATELIAPNNVPFLPGNNVTGFGAQVPAELAAAGFTNAIVFFSTEWNPANTTPTVKFRFIAGSSKGLSLGYGIADNPSVSQTARVISAGLLRTPGTFFGLELDNSAGTGSPLFYLTDDAVGDTGPGHGGLLNVLDAAGFARIRGQANSGGTQAVIGLYDTLNQARIQSTATNAGTTQWALIDKSNNARWILTDQNGGNTLLNVNDPNGIASLILGVSATDMTMAFGGGVLRNTYTSNNISTDYPIVMDTAWQALPLVGGWTGDATRVPLMRRMPDGTIQMKGVITKAANPVNGEQWINAVGTAYRPLHTWSFLTPTPGRPYNGSQVIEVRADGTGVIFDMAALPGIICLDNVRYSTI